MEQSEHPKYAAPRFYVLRRAFQARELLILGVLILELIVFALVDRSFVTASNLMDAARFAAIVGAAAIGACLVILLAGIDLSSGALYGLVGCVAMLLMTSPDHPMNAWLALAVAMLVGLAFGLINGFCIGYIKIPPFIVTLGTMSAASGTAILITKAEHMPSASRPLPEASLQVLQLMDTHLGRTAEVSGLHISVLIVIVLAILTALFLVGTKGGRYIFAIGGGEEAAEHAGINVAKVKLWTYAAAGCFSGLAGLFYVARFKGVNSGVGLGDELNIIAAAVVGGVSLSGGKGSPIGTIIGAMIVKLLRDGLVYNEVPESGAKIAVGSFIILAVLVDRLLKIAGRKRAS